MNGYHVKKEDLLFFLVSAILAFVFSWNGTVSQFEGIVLLMTFLLYCYFIKRNITNYQSDENKKWRRMEKH